MDYQLPYYDKVPGDPSIKEMKNLVVDQQYRPELRSLWLDCSEVCGCVCVCVCGCGCGCGCVCGCGCGCVCGCGCLWVGGCLCVCVSVCIRMLSCVYICVSVCAHTLCVYLAKCVLGVRFSTHIYHLCVWQGLEGWVRSETAGRQIPNGVAVGRDAVVHTSWLLIWFTLLSPVHG